MQSPSTYHRRSGIGRIVIVVVAVVRYYVHLEFTLAAPPRLPTTSEPEDFHSQSQSYVLSMIKQAHISTKNMSLIRSVILPIARWLP